MNIEGSYTLQASAEEVWRHLHRREVLLQALPELEQLERVDQDSYNLTLHIPYAPLDGTYHTLLKFTQADTPLQLSFVLEGQGLQNTLSGIGQVKIEGRERQQTIITYKGSLTLGKTSARLSPAVVKGAVKLFVQQTFTLLAEQLRSADNGHTLADRGTTLVRERGSDIIVIPSPQDTANGEYTSKPRSFWQRVARLLRLGNYDPEQEVRWGKRIQRLGSIGGLLFLIWVGTRIPRR